MATIITIDDRHSPKIIQESQSYSSIPNANNYFAPQEQLSASSRDLRPHHRQPANHQHNPMAPLPQSTQMSLGQQAPRTANKTTLSPSERRLRNRTIANPEQPKAYIPIGKEFSAFTSAPQQQQSMSKHQPQQMVFI